jgi:hypothetical protein
MEFSVSLSTRVFQMFKIAIPAVVALGLIAFAARSQATDSDLQAAPAAMGWHLSHEGSLAKLAYGVENSDQLALMMTCERGQTQATVFGDVQPAAAHLINTSMSGSIDPLSGDLADVSRISVRDPVVQQLARSGRMAVEAETGAYELTATSAERGVISQFIAYCGSAHV